MSTGLFQNTFVRLSLAYTAPSSFTKRIAASCLSGLIAGSLVVGHSAGQGYVAVVCGVYDTTL